MNQLEFAEDLIVPPINNVINSYKIYKEGDPELNPIQI